MPTAQTRNAVWLNMLDAARVTRYAEVMEARYRRVHLFVRFALLFSASAGAAAVLEVLPQRWALVSSALIASIIIWDLLTDYATKIAALKIAKRLCHVLEDDWRELWRTVDSDQASDEMLLARNAALLKQLHQATAPMDEHVSVVDRANSHAAEYVYAVMKHEHAAR